MRHQLKREAALATKLALLYADEIFVPAASYFESDLCWKVISEYKSHYNSLNLYLVGSGESIHSFIDAKKYQYKQNSLQRQKYKDAEDRLRHHPPFIPRKGNPSADIKNAWSIMPRAGRLKELVEGTSLNLPTDIENKWLKVPERIGDQAFLLENVKPHLLGKGNAYKPIENRVVDILNQQYFESYTKALFAGVITNLNYLSSLKTIPSYDRDLPFREICSELRKRGLLEQIEKSTPKSLLNIRNTPGLWAALEHVNKKSLNVTRRRVARGGATLLPSYKADIGIITALSEEFSAVCSVLKCESPIDVPGIGMGRKYATGSIATKSGAVLKVAVGLLSEPGTTSAAVQTTQMLGCFPTINSVLMVGIAGAVPKPTDAASHVRLGDIVVSDRNGVIKYDFIKDSLKSIEPRHPPRPPGSALLGIAKMMQADEMKNKPQWEHHLKCSIDELGVLWQRPHSSKDVLQDFPGDVSVHPKDVNRRKDVPRVFYGPIGSSDTLLKNPARRNFLRDKYGVKAIEMEGSGVAEAMWNFNKPYLVIRGTCDYCNDGKNDLWHQYASLIAAAYCRALIENLSLDK